MKRKQATKSDYFDQSKKATDRANFNCPNCDRSDLRSVRGELEYTCESCGETAHVVDIAHDNGIDELTDDADHVGWIAEALLDLEG